jgi:hypothetical protein
MNLETVLLTIAPLFSGFVVIASGLACGIFAARARREARSGEAAFHSLIVMPFIVFAGFYITHWFLYANDASCAPFPSTLRGFGVFAWFLAIAWVIPAFVYARIFIRNYKEKVKLAHG